VWLVCRCSEMLRATPSARKRLPFAVKWTFPQMDDTHEPFGQPGIEPFLQLAPQQGSQPHESTCSSQDLYEPSLFPGSPHRAMTSE
jgi:hypothetical protein